MWDLIVSVPDHCLSFYFAFHCTIASTYINPLSCAIGKRSYGERVFGWKGTTTMLLAIL